MLNFLQIIRDQGAKIQKQKWDIEDLQRRVKQLECSHQNVKFSINFGSLSRYVKHCTDCGKIIEKWYCRENYDIARAEYETEKAKETIKENKVILDDAKRSDNVRIHEIG